MTTKDQVLAVLLDAGKESVSGERLAKLIGVSRNAIWKSVKCLRSEGYEIESCTNRGYRLLGEREILSEIGIRKHLRTEMIGRYMEVHSVIDSTNSVAKNLARKGAPEGTMVVARGQTAGRGRFGRKFHSPADAGIYISFVLRPRIAAERAVLVTAMCAVAVARAIEKLADVTAGIKWVNDIFLNGKKTAGILCEAELEIESGKPAYVVAGIGVNVKEQEFPDELKDIATSIGNVCGKNISGNQLIAEICFELEKLMHEGNYMTEYRARSVVIGKNVLVLNGDSEYRAVVESIGDEGSLYVKTEFGVRKVTSGEIRIIEEELL